MQETKTCEDGSPLPCLQATGRESAGTDSEQRVKKVCPTPYEPVVCISRARGGHCLLSGSVCEPCDRDENIKAPAPVIDTKHAQMQREIDAIRQNQIAHGIIDAEESN